MKTGYRKVEKAATKILTKKTDEELKDFKRNSSSQYVAEVRAKVPDISMMLIYRLMARCIVVEQKRRLENLNRLARESDDSYLKQKRLQINSKLINFNQDEKK